MNMVKDSFRNFNVYSFKKIPKELWMSPNSNTKHKFFIHMGWFEKLICLRFEFST